MKCHLAAVYVLMHAHFVLLKAAQIHREFHFDLHEVHCCGMMTYLTVWCQVWKAVHVSKLMQGGLPGGALLAPSQGPKCEVPSIFGSQHSSGLPSLIHTQGNAWPCNITTNGTQQLHATRTCMPFTQSAAGVKGGLDSKRLQRSSWPCSIRD